MPTDPERAGNFHKECLGAVLVNHDQPGPFLDSHLDELASFILDEEAKLFLAAFFASRK